MGLPNFFMGLNEQRYPRQMFADEDEAVAWLRKYVE